MSIEHGFIPEQKEIQPRRKERYELKDKEGNTIGVSLVEFFDEKEKEYPETKGKPVRKLKSFVLEKDGKSVNVLDVVRTLKPVQIFVSAHETNFSFNPKKNVLIVPPLDHTVGIAVALHEIGHAEQSGLAFFESILETRQDLASLDQTRVIPVFSENIVSAFVQLRKDFPELLPFFPSDETFVQLEEIRMLANGVEELDRKIEDIERLLNRSYASLEAYNQRTNFKIGQQGYNERRKKIEEELRELRKQRTELEQAVLANGEDRKQLMERYDDTAKPLEQMMMIVEKVLERDATKRAFQMMEYVYREIGADLMSPHVDISKQYSHLFDKRDVCTESTTRLMDNIQKFGGYSAKGALLSALGSYNALDRIPIPTIKRLEHMEQERWEQQQKSSGT